MKYYKSKKMRLVCMECGEPAHILGAYCVDEVRVGIIMALLITFIISLVI